MTDLERAIAVIADLCGAGRPAVKETKEELAEWAEEFTNRYFSGDTSDGYPLPIDQWGDPTLALSSPNYRSQS
jgi:hypothetical protein